MMNINRDIPIPFYYYSVFIVLVSIFLIQAPVFAQDHPVDAPTIKEIIKAGDTDTAQKSPPRTKAPYDKLNRGTPRSSIMSLSETMGKGDHALTMEFLDLRQVPQHIADEGPDLVRKLRIIADRTFWMGPENLSMEPEGHRDDGLPSYRDRVATINTPDGPVDLLLQRVPGDNKGDFIWKVSNRTVAGIPRLYELYGYGELGFLQRCGCRNPKTL